MGGAVVGLDMAAALAVAEARGLDRAAMADLLFAGEAGLLRAVNKGPEDADEQ